MIDITRIRNDADSLKKLLSDRLSIAHELIDDILKKDSYWRSKKTELDQINAERKKITGKSEQASSLKKQQKALEQEVHELERELIDNLQRLPNIPLEDTPQGTSEKNNKVLKEVGTKPTGVHKPYTDLNIAHTDLHLEAGAQASGARFSYISGDLARLEFALTSFAISLLQKRGFMLVFPPTIIKKQTMRAMGYLDQAGEKEIFSIGNPVSDEELVLIGTGEQALGGMYLNTTFQEQELPKRLLTFTPCYRREAGSYGKDTKGILRQHQFEKLEMFSFTTEEASREEHALFVSIQEELVSSLRLPYRLVSLAAGDLGYPSAQTIDLEIWFPGQQQGKGEYRETHSASNCTDYQSRRLNTRYKTRDQKIKFTHTVNGTAFAMQRMLIAIMEQYQKDGTCALADMPAALKPYLS